MQTAILKTLVYADVFDYPLKLYEIEKYLIGTRAGEILIDRKLIGEKEGFYFLKGREEIVELRKKRAEWSRKKIEIAKRTAEKLKIIPMIKMIGITGALSMENCKEEDDIDLLIITDADCLWLTRLLIILFSPLLGIKRRKPKEEIVRNKICFNLFLEENHLKIEPENLFLAHEVCQVRPLVDKDFTYQNFLEENKWVKKYLPNATKITNHKPPATNHKKCLLSFLDTLAFKLQYLYMKPKMTIERVNLHQAFFHPKNLQLNIEEKFNLKLFFLGLDNS